MGMEALIGALAVFATTYYDLVLTDQRLIMIRLTKRSGRPRDIIWAVTANFTEAAEVLRQARAGSRAEAPTRAYG
jgi:hypothetical protein